MHDMTRYTRKITLYTVIGIVTYLTLVYLLLNIPIFSKVTSFMRNVMSMKVSNGVYGIGTIMVDVRSLGKKISQDNDLRTEQYSRKTLYLGRKEGETTNSCFYLSHQSIFRKRNKYDFSEKKQTLEKNTMSNKFLDLNKVSASKDGGKNDCNSYITIDSPPGRSGNQMFQIAALIGVAYNRDLIPVISPNFPLSEWLELPNLLDLKLINAQSFSAKRSGKYLQDINSLSNTNNWTLRGYFQSWKYFRNAETIIRNVFKIKDKYLNVAKSFMRNISETGQINVCVHVRRGDLSDDIAERKGYSIAGLDFIYNAMRFYRKQFKNVQFIILSDGILWCMENIKGDDVIFSPFYRHAEDMALMTLCDHVVVTSGTFGWWGAWLSGGTTGYFNGYPRQGSWLASQINKNDYYPPEWIAL